MSRVIESAGGLAAYSGTESRDRPARIERYIQVYAKDHGMVAVPLVAAGPHAGDQTPTLLRKREHVWSEVHDPFDTRSAEVDARSSGDPIGNPHGRQWHAGE